MQSSSDNLIEHLLEQRVLSLFTLPRGNVTWHGYSELNTQSLVYYFSINKFDYLLVNQVHHGVSDSTFFNSVIENTVAPYQKLVLIPPKESMHKYVSISKDNGEWASKLAGDFSLFQIFN